MIFGLTFYQLALYALWFFAYSFAGWIWEVALRLVQRHQFVNRGFVYGPVLPIYGAGGLIAVVALDPIAAVLPGTVGIAVQFAAGCIVAAVVEYATSWAMERLFHARWWDYTGKPFNLNGRIYLLGIVLFGAMMVVVARVVQPALADLTARLDPDVLEFAATVLFALFAADLAMSVVRMQSFNERLELIQAKLVELTDDARHKALEVRASASDAMGEARGALADAGRTARARMSEAVDEGRARVSDAMDEGRSRMDGSRETLEAKIRELLPRLPRPSLFDRHTVNNPFFTPTRNREAFEWVARRIREMARPDAQDPGKDDANK